MRFDANAYTSPSLPIASGDSVCAPDWSSSPCDAVAVCPESSVSSDPRQPATDQSTPAPTAIIMCRRLVYWFIRILCLRAKFDSGPPSKRDDS